MSNDKRHSQKSDPFSTYDLHYNERMLHANEVFNARPMQTPEEISSAQNVEEKTPAPVSLPKHIFLPEDSFSLDWKNTVIVNAAVAGFNDVLTYRVPKNQFIKITQYAFYIQNYSLDIAMLPMVNGNRILTWHGNPMLNFDLQGGLGLDLSDYNLIRCNIDLQPNDVLTWKFRYDATGLNYQVGVRVTGYVDMSSFRKPGKFGG